MKKSVFWSFLAVLAVFLMACSTAPQEQLKSEMTVKADETGPLLSAFSQSITDKNVVIEKTILDKPGYVVIHADANGKPGAVIAHSDFLQAGKYTNLKIDTTTLNEGTTKIWLMLHYDDGDGKYDILYDLPSKMDGNNLESSIDITYQAGASSGKIKITKYTAVKTADGYTVKFGLQNLQATESSTTIVVRLFFAGKEVAKQTTSVTLSPSESKDFEVPFISPPQFVGFNIEGDAIVNPLNK